MARGTPVEFGDFVKQPEKNERPTVVPDAGACQRLLDIAARADVYEAIRQGLDDVAHGRTQPAREVLDEIRRRHGMPR